MTRLAFLLSAGIPFIQAFSLVVDKEKVLWKKKHLQKILSSIVRGKSISKSFDQPPFIVDRSTLRVIQNAELSGTLSKSLVLITQDLSTRLENKRQIIGALMYPCVVVAFSVLLALFLYVFVFPQIIPIITANNVDLPMTTQALIMSFDVLTNYGVILIGSFIILILSFSSAYKYLLKFRSFVEFVVIKMPVSGYIIRLNKIGGFCRTVALFLESGHTLVESLSYVSDYERSYFFKNIFISITRQVQYGKRFSSTLDSKLFSHEMIQFVSAGEESGGLSTSLRHVAHLYENDMKNFQKKLFTLIEPLLMIILGIVVGIIALALVVPMYNLTAI